jgi:hypothetical protein
VPVDIKMLNLNLTFKVPCIVIYIYIYIKCPRINVLGEKMGAHNIVKEIKQYQKQCLQHVQRMDTNRIPKQALKYRPKGRRNIGRPRKTWRDQLHLED